MEERVRERTAELARSNEQLSREVRVRRRVEGKIRRSEDALLELSSRLLDAQEIERQRIARELHDTIGQTLSAVKFTVENLFEQTREERHPSFSQTYDSLMRLLQDGMEELRRTQKNLRPPMLDDLGIIATVSWYCREFSVLYPAIAIEKSFDLAEQEVPDHLKIVIYRILQEAMNNVARHSGASRVSVSLGCSRGRLGLTVRDNGGGFNPDKPLGRGDHGSHFGLLSMKKRAELSGGSLRVESVPGQGTSVRASWKQAQPPRAPASNPAG